MKPDAKSLSVPASAPPGPLLRLGRLIWFWGPLLVWMLVMFGLSTDAGATRNSSRIIGPVLRWFYPGISDEAIGAVQLVARKGAHITEYAILAALAWRARRRPCRGDLRPWRRGDAFFALGVAVLFAITDEWHQSHVPSRQGQVTDVLFDTLGAAAGVWVLWAWGRWRQRW